MMQNYKLKYKFKKWTPDMYDYEEKNILPFYPSKRTITLYNMNPNTLPPWLAHHITQIAKKRRINNKRRYFGINITETININKQEGNTIFIEHGYGAKYSGFIGKIITSLTATQRHYTESGMLKNDELFININTLRTIYKSPKPALKLIENLTTPLKNTGMYDEPTTNLINTTLNTTWGIDEIKTTLITWKGQGVRVIMSDYKGKLHHTWVKNPRKNNHKETITKFINKILEDLDILT